MSYINTQAIRSYQNALIATKGIEAPAARFSRPQQISDEIASKTAAIIKQNNTQIQLLVTICEKLEQLEERVKRLEGKLLQETTLPDSVIESLNEKIRDLKILEKEAPKTGKLLIFKDPYELLKQEKARSAAK